MTSPYRRLEVQVPGDKAALVNKTLNELVSDETGGSTIVQQRAADQDVTIFTCNATPARAGDYLRALHKIGCGSTFGICTLISVDAARPAPDRTASSRRGLPAEEVH